MTAVPDDCSRTYEILRPLGTGGFGTVFLARHRPLGREVALEVLEPEMVMLDQGAAAIPWIAYEYRPGRTVKDLLAAGPVQWRDAIAIAAQVAAALEAAHDAGVIHRDIKAENVLEASPGHRWRDLASLVISASRAGQGRRCRRRRAT